MKKSTRVEIPRNARDIVELASKIVKHHEELGTESPIINAIDMELFKQRFEEATIEMERSETLRKEAEAATEKRNNLVGIAKNQAVTTKGTLLQLVTSIRDVLLGTFKGEEHQMGAFGFTVASTTRSSSGEEVEAEVNVSENGQTTDNGSNGSVGIANKNGNTDVESAPTTDG